MHMGPHSPWITKRCSSLPASPVLHVHAAQVSKGVGGLEDLLGGLSDARKHSDEEVGQLEAALRQQLSFQVAEGQKSAAELPAAATTSTCAL